MVRIRRIVYLTVIIAIGLYLFNFESGLSFSRTSIPPAIEKTDIIHDFQDLSQDKGIPFDIIDSDFDKSIYFPQNYTGQAGDIFYLAIGKNIFKYKIETVGAGRGTSIIYKLQDSYSDLSLPEHKFEIYDLKSTKNLN